MLSIDFLKKLAVKNQTSEVNVLREYVQNLILHRIYQQEQAAGLFFKGGTALRLIYKSPRFSEDLDFDTNIHEIQVWEQVLEQVLVELDREGVKVEIIDSTETSGGYLGKISVENLSRLVVIKFEISFRKNNTKGEVFSIDNEFGITYSLVSLKTGELVDGKISALLDRQKARDFYDLYFMLRKNMLTVQQKVKLSEVTKIIEKTEIQFEKELGLFLPKSQTLLVKNFRETLMAEISRN